jgi:hypothetical protein
MSRRLCCLAGERQHPIESLDARIRAQMEQPRGESLTLDHSGRGRDRRVAFALGLGVLSRLSPSS